ncbi:MAG: hypothetical protein F6K48_12415 [Okeania sp. SIO3H1]|nr:hypothetical protein [Okeania sp. SIO3H1]
MRIWYDINLNYLGVNPPLAPPGRGRGRQSSGVRREQRRRNRSIRRKFFGRVSGTEFYRALIRTDIIAQITNAQK